METARFDFLLGTAAMAHSRRDAMLGAGVARLGLAAAPEAGQAKKGKRKRPCKSAKKNPARTPSCAEQCFPEFALCFTRPEGAPLCVDGADTGGLTPRETDQDCIGDPVGPYCLVSGTDGVSGAPDRFTTREPYAVGGCLAVLVV